MTQAKRFNTHVMMARSAVSLNERDGLYVVALDDSHELLTRSVVLALGVQYPRLPIPRLAEYEGRGAFNSVDSARQQLLLGGDVVVIGGTNSAAQSALASAGAGRKVHLVVEAGNVEHTITHSLQSRIAEAGVDILYSHKVCELSGQNYLENIIVEHVVTGERREIKAGAMVIPIGVVPRTEWLAGIVALDDEGFVLTDSALPADILKHESWIRLGRAPFLLETSRPGVFAVGDV